MTDHAQALDYPLIGSEHTVGNLLTIFLNHHDIEDNLRCETPYDDYPHGDWCHTFPWRIAEYIIGNVDGETERDYMVNGRGLTRFYAVNPDDLPHATFRVTAFDKDADEWKEVGRI